MKRISTQKISQLKGKPISIAFQSNKAPSNFLATKVLIPL